MPSPTASSRSAPNSPNTSTNSPLPPVLSTTSACATPPNSCLSHSTPSPRSGQPCRTLTTPVASSTPFSRSTPSFQSSPTPPAILGIPVPPLLMPLPPPPFPTIICPPRSIALSLVCQTTSATPSSVSN